MMPGKRGAQVACQSELSTAMVGRTGPGELSQEDLAEFQDLMRGIILKEVARHRTSIGAQELREEMHEAADKLSRGFPLAIVISEPRRSRLNARLQNQLTNFRQEQAELREQINLHDLVEHCAEMMNSGGASECAINELLLKGYNQLARDIGAGVFLKNGKSEIQGFRFPLISFDMEDGDPEITYAISKSDLEAHLTFHNPKLLNDAFRRFFERCWVPAESARRWLADKSIRVPLRWESRDPEGQEVVTDAASNTVEERAAPLDHVHTHLNQTNDRLTIPNKPGGGGKKMAAAIKAFGDEVRQGRRTFEELRAMKQKELVEIYPGAGRTLHTDAREKALQILVNEGYEVLPQTAESGTSPTNDK